MLEKWINMQGLHHLNQSEKCIGTYTYGRPGKPSSAIDHILLNNNMEEKFKGMLIDENAEELNISDHNLIRSWFKIGRKGGTSWRKSETEIRTWYAIDTDSLNKMEKEIESRTRGPISFNSMMNNIELAQEKHLKKTRKIKLGVKGKKQILSAV